MAAAAVINNGVMVDGGLFKTARQKASLSKAQASELLNISIDEYESIESGKLLGVQHVGVLIERAMCNQKKCNLLTVKKVESILNMVNESMALLEVIQLRVDEDDRYSTLFDGISRIMKLASEQLENLI